MKIKIGTILLILIISLSALMGFRQYQRDESAKKSTESEPQTEISWNTPYSKATMKKVADLGEIESESYDVTRSFYKDYDDTGLETCILTGIFADTEEAAIKQIREGGNCKYAYLTEDGKCEIKLTEQQRESWIEIAENTLNQIEAENNADYSFEISNGYKNLNIVANSDGDAIEFHSSTMRILFAIEIIQMFNGADDWNVDVIVMNAKNGKEVINVAFPKEEFTIKPEMWEE